MSFRSLTDSRDSSNTIVCVPQIIATLEIFAQAAAPNCRKFIRELIFPECSSLISNGNLASYIDEWEKAAHAAATPGCFITQRRFLVHPTYTKSYGFETFTTLKAMGTEVKIMSNYNIAEQKDIDPKEIDPKEVVDWLRRICKV